MGSAGTVGNLGNGSLIVNGQATAPTCGIGAGGLMGGSGLYVCDVYNCGTISPGSSLGRLTIDGALDSDGGKILIEVEALPGGGYAVDELVFSDALRVLLGHAQIEFSFLGDTDPASFNASGLFNVASFFNEIDASGAVVGFGSGRFGLFNDALFSARSDRYTFNSFSFSAAGGAAIDLAPLPVPATLTLVLMGLLGLPASRRRNPVKMTQPAPPLHWPPARPAPAARRR